MSLGWNWVVNIRVSGVELGAEDGGRKPEPKVHVTCRHVPQHHIPVSGGAEELTTTPVPAAADSHRQREGKKESEEGGRE